MWMMDSKFRENGNTGYVLKPSRLTGNGGAVSTHTRKIDTLTITV